ncbi:hypothetical protein [Lactococcus fujiensis]|uniref:hypothetical protein n=1 Tax=Lactococcus fujiensis TaxID=610251 RepID=UPI0006D28C58|nr:hypothetical protein [Lactococcus fujiensis]
MQKEEKSKFKDNLVLKELSLVGLVALWGLLIFFKEQLSFTWQVICFIVLVVFTIYGIIIANRAFFGVEKKK